MKKIVLAAVAVVTLAVPALADNTATVVQAGTGVNSINYAAINQVGRGNNSASAIQVGTANGAYIAQSGRNNAAVVGQGGAINSSTIKQSSPTLVRPIYRFHR